MRAGQLRHRITIQENTPAPDDYGGAVDSWAEVDVVWGSVEPLAGREFLDARRLEAEVTTRIRIRYLAGLVPGMRATWDGHTYDITAVLETESRRREIVLMCREWGLDR